jgi:hypothetical protein
MQRETIAVDEAERVVTRTRMPNSPGTDLPLRARLGPLPRYHMISQTFCISA